MMLSHNQNQGLVLPTIATFILSLNRLSGQLQFLAERLNFVSENSGQMLRLDGVLETEGKEFTRVGGEKFEGLKHQISLEKVSLRYNKTSNPVLVDLSFKLPKNTLTALVGESGSGKSSITDLIIGLYEPTEGSILVDGLDLHSYSLESWRNQLGVVSQDTFIFNQSILENIRYGLPQATDADVREAARQAQAEIFIEAMPEAYNTIVGERGYKLSGGQRQRIALARAILKRPEILILDEATSALDSETEQLVQQALNQLGCDRTVLVVAHRLSTIVHADQILVLDSGQVVESGNHQDLLALGGKYARYWAMQSIA
jgi:ATP-binding cassette subfamily B protein/subfamily B ATP-binding cassette protein MsbA